MYKVFILKLFFFPFSFLVEYVKIEWSPLRVEVLLLKRVLYRGNVLSYARIITLLGNIYKEMFFYSDNITTDLALKTSFFFFTCNLC
jgi:hypothetical protein